MEDGGDDLFLGNEINATTGLFDWDAYCGFFRRDDENETDTNTTELLVGAGDGINSNNNTEAAAICALFERYNDDTQGDEDENVVRITLDDVTILFQLVGGILLLWMAASYPMRLAGNCRTVYAKDSLTKSLAAAPFTAMAAFYFFGYAFAFGPAISSKTHRRNFVGVHYRGLNGAPDDIHTMFFIQTAYCLASTGIWTGAVAERGHMALFFYGTLFLAAWVYPVVAHTLWSTNGLLSAYLMTSSEDYDLYHDMGVIDLHGSGVVHMTGGVAAFLAAKILKPRTGRFHDPETGKKLDRPTKYAAHSVGLQALGTFLFWMGSYGAVFVYDNAHVAALVAVNTTLAAGMAGFVGLFADSFLSSALTGLPEYHLLFALHGAETGLVSIAAGAAIVEPWAAAAIGAIAGLIYVGSHRLVEELKFFRVDDIVNAVPVHGYGGMWGLVSVAIFAQESLLEQAGFPSDVFVGLVYGLSNLKFLLVQLAGLGFILGWVSINMAFLCFVLRFLGIIRDDIVPGDEDKEEDEEVKDGEENDETSSNDGNNDDEDHDADPTENEPYVDDDDEEEMVDDSSANYLSDDLDPDDDVELQEALHKRNEKFSNSTKETEGLNQFL
mmetsp:Transcript_25528/g.48353  ORF Transcript_25528/g.48353 Transcript_25528/m.48353 type:complete len:610 (+) Transcript_25528:34-1863(+)|eukprot:scaffold1276_cov162-Amphora_coffeaeformis.AAC.16